MAAAAAVAQDLAIYVERLHERHPSPRLVCSAGDSSNSMAKAPWGAGVLVVAWGDSRLLAIDFARWERGGRQSHVGGSCADVAHFPILAWQPHPRP